MKLQNKRTGEIVEWFNNTDGRLPNSLAELNEEWEDYEEPNKYWYVGDRGAVFCEKIEEYGHIWDEARREIGNYFETKEEAEKAVEKLKAWKRLKDKGFKFAGWEESPIDDDFDTIYFITKNRALDDETQDSLTLLFGGEE